MIQARSEGRRPHGLDTSLAVLLDHDDLRASMLVHFGKKRNGQGNVGLLALTTGERLVGGRTILRAREAVCRLSDGRARIRRNPAIDPAALPSSKPISLRVK